MKNQNEIEKEFNLSEKKCILQGYENDILFHIEDVKEFIRLLKEKIKKLLNRREDLELSYIDELAGDKLK